MDIDAVRAKAKGKGGQFKDKSNNKWGKDSYKGAKRKFDKNKTWGANKGPGKGKRLRLALTGQ